MAQPEEKPRVEAGNSSPISQGNICSSRERLYRLLKLREEIRRGWVDLEIIPFLRRINKFSFLVTTQSCCGHGENPRIGRKAHIDFRSLLNETDTINKIIRPFLMKRNPPDLAIELMVEPYGIRYIVWLRNDRWEEQLEDFIGTLLEVKP